MSREQPLITVRNFWGKKFAIFSAFVIVITGITVVLFDNTDHTKFMQFGQPAGDTTQAVTAPAPDR